MNEEREQRKRELQEELNKIEAEERHEEQQQLINEQLAFLESGNTILTLMEHEQRSCRQGERNNRYFSVHGNPECTKCMFADMIEAYNAHKEHSDLHDYDVFKALVENRVKLNMKITQLDE